MGSIYDWSVVPFDNQTADAEINWREGQLPSTINDSARVMMARLAEFLLDTQSILDLQGGGLSYTFNTKMRLNVYCKSLQFKVSPQQACVDKPTLKLNNLAACPLVKLFKGKLINLDAGDFLPDEIYTISYMEDNDKFRKGAWRVHNISKSSVPSGVIYAFAGNSTKLDGWLLCDGQEVKVSEYEYLYNAIGDNWGRASRNGYFKLPNLQGSFLRGADINGILDKSGAREIGSMQLDSIKMHKHNATMGAAGEHSHEFSCYIADGDSPSYKTGFVYRSLLVQPTSFTVLKAGAHQHDITIENAGDGAETRPVNHAVHYFIKV